MAFTPPPSFEIPRPPLEAPLHGLLSVAYTPDLSDVPDEDKERWRSGITFPPTPVSCTDRPVPWMASTDNPLDKQDPGAALPISKYHSFTLTYTLYCQASQKQLKDDVEKAKQALDVGSGQAIEAILWGPNTDSPISELFFPTGLNYSLSGSTPLVTGYDADSCNGILNRTNPLGADIGAMTPKQAALALTQALANCGFGSRGFIHAPVYLAEDWAEDGLIKASDVMDISSPYVTNIRGDYIVGGSGYSGTGPLGHPLETPADGFAWAYASAPVGVIMSEPEEKETTTIDHTINLHKVIVERTVALAINPSCLYAVYVDVA